MVFPQLRFFRKLVTGQSVVSYAPVYKLDICASNVEVIYVEGASINVTHKMNKSIELFIFQFIALIALLSGDFAYAHKVIGISDGDTMILLIDSKPVKIRLANIDAPEKKKPFGQKSKESLSEICWGTDATYVPQTTDRYGRTVAVVFCNGIEANKEQVRRGMAWVYPRYNKDRMLPSIQAEAKDHRVGLWSEREPFAPWEFRVKQ